MATKNSYKVEVENLHALVEEKIREIIKLKEALIWCSGSEDFNEGGKARKGWLKICSPLLKNKINNYGKRKKQQSLERSRDMERGINSW